MGRKIFWKECRYFCGPYSISQSYNAAPLSPRIQVLTGQAKVFAEIQLQKMADVTEARKASVAKKKDTGKQLTIEAVLAGKRDDLVHSGSESSDNETGF